MKDKFFLFLEEISQHIERNIDSNKRFLIITHIDADGLSSATLFLHYLYYNNAETHLIYAKHLDESFIKDLYNRYPEDVFIFLDLGSGIIDKIKIYSTKETYIFDHHDLVLKDRVLKNVVFQVNPRIFGIDGSREISTSGIIYYFLKKANHDFQDIAFLGLIGAIGDMQENGDFIGLNKRILEDLVNEGLIKVKKGLKLFGLASKPLYRALQYSAEVYIPGVTGDEGKAIELLNTLRIPLKKRGSFTTYLDLAEEEQRKLISEIIKIRLRHDIPDAENVLGNLYLIENGFYFKELREIAYIFNAAGRLNKPSRAIAFFLGDRKYLDDVQDIIIDYKRMIVELLNKIYNGEVPIIEKGGIAIIDLSGHTELDTLASPIATIFANNKYINSRILIVTVKQNEEYYKVSVRLVGSPPGKNLSKVVRMAAEKVGGFGGGHDVAAGAVIPIDKFEEFVKYLRILARQESILI